MSTVRTATSERSAAWLDEGEVNAGWAPPDRDPTDYRTATRLAACWT